MTSTPLYHIHTIYSVVAQISQGEDPWFALGNFLHDWWCHTEDVRRDLIAEPPAVATGPEERRWAAFCAATVEALCSRTALACPAWVTQPDYFLEYPWFYYPQPSQRDWLLSTTPEPFKRRNIFVGGNVLDNKYELYSLFGSKPKWEMWSDQELKSLSS